MAIDPFYRPRISDTDREDCSAWIIRGTDDEPSEDSQCDNCGASEGGHTVDMKRLIWTCAACKEPLAIIPAMRERDEA